MFDSRCTVALRPGLCARCPGGARSSMVHPSYARTIMQFDLLADLLILLL